MGLNNYTSVRTDFVWHDHVFDFTDYVFDYSGLRGKYEPCIQSFNFVSNHGLAFGKYLTECFADSYI